MTRRTWIVLGVLVLLPILITGIVLIRWKIRNPVVATYGINVDEVHYGKKTLYAVSGVDGYMAEPGNFLGKVQNALTGAGIYTVKYDKTGEMWAIVTEKGTVIYTESGKLPADAYGGTKVSVVFFDAFTPRVTEKDRISLLNEIGKNTGDAVIWLPQEKEMPLSFRMHLCYDGSAVSTVSPGRLLYFSESELWYYLPDAEEKAVKAQIEAGEIASNKAVYRVLPVTERATRLLLKALLLDKDDSDWVLPSSAVTTAAAPHPQAPSSAIGSSGVLSSGI